MTNSKNRVTKLDVAKLANVSHMTVTRALSENSSVKAETRKKVLAACEELGYTPNLEARSLRSQKSDIFGVVVPSLKHSYYSRIIGSIESMAGAMGYHILVQQLHEDKSLILDDIKSLVGRCIDGLFVVGPDLDRTICNYLQSNRVPLVFLNNPGYIQNEVFIGVDNVEGLQMAIDYLVSLGHKRIAHIAGVEGSYTGTQRVMGYKQSLKSHGITVSDDDIYFTDYSMQGGYYATETLVKSGRKYSALSCANDYIAFGAISYLHKSGIRVPYDISVIGFTGDDIGEFSVPALTTVHEPAEEMGVNAVECMLSQVSGRCTSKKILLRPELVVRESTSKANS